MSKDSYEACEFDNFICEQKNIDKIKKHLEIY